MKRLGLLLLCLMLLCGMTVRAEEAPDGFLRMAEKDGNTLYLNGATGEIAVRDAGGFLWRSAVTDQCSLDGLTASQRALSQTPLIVEYTLLNNRSNQSIRRSLSELGLSVTYEPRTDGVRVVYFAQEIALRVTVDYTLTADGLRVRIPADGIEEGVGLTEKLDVSMKNIRENIEWMRNVITVMQADTQLSNHQRNIGRFEKAFEKFAEELEEITTAIDIKNTVEKATALMTTCQSIYKGGVGEEGVFNAIVADESIAVETRQYYKQVYNQLDKTFTQTRLFSQQLTSIKYCAVTAISVLPNFGALGDFEDGYVFYPDGSGALAYATPEHPSYQHYFQESVYSDDTPALDDLLHRGESGRQPVLMPVFGAKHDSAAYVAFVEEGAEYAAMEYYPSGLNLNVHRVDAYFRCRRTAAVYDNGSSRGSIYELTRFDTPYTVLYCFLPPESADYSGMACRYRQYLVENGLLRQSKLTQRSGTVALELIMGVTKSGLITRQLEAVTTFEQAEKIVSELRGAGVDNLLIDVRGYTKYGYAQVNALRTDAASQLGGMSGLEKLCTSLDGTGALLLLENDHTAQVAANASFRNNDYAYDNTGTLMTDSQRHIYLLKPTKALEYLMQLQLPELTKRGVDGMVFTRIGSYLYYDQQTGHQTARGETMTYWQQMMHEARTQLGVSAVRSAGVYALAEIDWALDTPDSDTGYVFTDESVPFYQMVLHGYIAYSQKPFNKFYDAEYETLKMLEYGAMPVFDLTWAETARLKDSSCYDQFSTCFADWKDTIAQTADLMRQMQPIVNQPMMRHERNADDTVRVTYANGAYLMLNYGDAPVETDGVTIDAMDWHLFTEGGGQE